jgi:hypothetical protein
MDALDLKGVALSYNTTQRHAEIAAQPWARYVTKSAVSN